MKLLFISLIVLLTSVEPPKDELFEPVVVLELFTSQGCSSCPPADKLLNDTNKNYDGTQVLALSYHVDYWNYIGWKDPFSKKEFSDLQRNYGRKFNNSSIYTPQMVVNGMEHFVGSNEGILEAKIKSYQLVKAQNSISILDVKKEGKLITFDYTVEGTLVSKQLRVALVVNERTTSVSTGENKNTSLKNSNIVVAQSKINLNSKTGTASIDVPQLVNSSDKLSLIILVETTDSDIVGGKKVKL